MLKLLKNTKVLMALGMLLIVIFSYMMGKRSTDMSNSEVNKRWNKLSPQMQHEAKEMVLKLKDAIEAESNK